MTSHYMRCRVMSSFEMVFEALSKAFGDIYSRKLGEEDESLNGIILGEQRCCSFNHLTSQFSQWNVHDVKNFLQNSGFRIEVEEEISYFGRSSS